MTTLTPDLEPPTLEPVSPVVSSRGKKRPPNPPANVVDDSDGDDVAVFVANDPTEPGNLVGESGSRCSDKRGDDSGRHSNHM